MKAFAGFIRLLRPINLIIIALTMYMIRYFIIGGQLSVEPFKFELPLTHFQFAMLTLSVVLLAAAGNIINDYFDMRVDRINKPDKVILGRLVKRRWAMLIHFFFNFIAIGIGFWLSLVAGIWELFSIHIFAATSLWFYSVIFKRQMLIGNFVIALLAGLVPLIVAFFEIPMILKLHGSKVVQLYGQHSPDTDPNIFFNILYAFCFGYAIFAFITTLIREVQKDMADMEGDQKVGYNTLPIVTGEKVAKFLVAFAIVCTIITIYICQVWYFNNLMAFWYFSGAIVLPLLVSMVLTLRAGNRRQHLQAAFVMKIGMLGGILFPIIFPMF